MTPNQWSSLRDLIRAVRAVAFSTGNMNLLMRAQHFLTMTEGRDV